MPERASRLSSTTWGSGLMSSADGSRMPSSQPTGWAVGTGVASGAQPAAGISPANNRSDTPRRGRYMRPRCARCVPPGRAAARARHPVRRSRRRLRAGEGPAHGLRRTGRGAPHGQGVEPWPTCAEMAANGPDHNQPDTGSSSAGIGGASIPPRDPDGHVADRRIAGAGAFAGVAGPDHRRGAAAAGGRRRERDSSRAAAVAR